MPPEANADEMRKTKNVETNTKHDKFTEDELSLGVPPSVPAITDIKLSLPPECFVPDLKTSFYFVAKDTAIVATLYLSMLALEFQPSVLLKWLCVPIYWYLQGTMMAAVFCLGHDCGHGSFSSSSALNDIVGNVLHTLIMVPYYPWKLSHRHHHKNTGNMDRDEIFYPERVRDPARVKEERPFFLPYFGLGVGWFAYVAKGYRPRAFSHFNPFAPMLVRHWAQCLVSLGCLTAWTSLALVPYGRSFGWDRLAVHYAGPVFGFACWIVFITFLHHHDELTPWYSDDKWDFVRGQLSSVDRHYGWAHGLLHNIGTHQIHHLFTKVPHYHLERATEIFRQKYPHLVRKSDERVVPAFVRMFGLFREGYFVGEDTHVHSYGGGAAVEEKTKSL